MQAVLDMMRHETTEVQRELATAETRVGQLVQSLRLADAEVSSLTQLVRELAAAIVLLEDAPPGATAPAGGSQGRQPGGASPQTLGL